MTSFADSKAAPHESRRSKRIFIIVAKPSARSMMGLMRRAYSSRVVTGILLRVMRIPPRTKGVSHIRHLHQYERETPAHVLLCPPGGGNIGDQAMVESFINNVPGPIQAIVRSENDYSKSSNWPERVEIIAAPALVYGSWLKHIRDVYLLRRVLSTSQTFSVVGADIMDGAYSQLASVNRARTLRIALQCGQDTRVLGFSWNETPTGPAVRELRAASVDGAVLYARDPISAERLVQKQFKNIRAVADIVFADDMALSSERVRKIIANVPDGKSIVLMNASGLVGRLCNQVDAYVAVGSRLSKLGYYPIVLPHVIRNTGDDLAECKLVHAKIGVKHATLVDELLLPAEVRMLCSRSSLVVTGRMHLGVIALSLGIPSVLVATQGKVEGLAKMFDISNLVVMPDKNLQTALINAVDSASASRATLGAGIERRLDSVRLLARMNFPHSSVQDHES